MSKAPDHPQLTDQRPGQQSEIPRPSTTGGDRRHGEDSCRPSRWQPPSRRRSDHREQDGRGQRQVDTYPHRLIPAVRTGGPDRAWSTMPGRPCNPHHRTFPSRTPATNSGPARHSPSRSMSRPPPRCSSNLPVRPGPQRPCPGSQPTHPPPDRPMCVPRGSRRWNRSPERQNRPTPHPLLLGIWTPSTLVETLLALTISRTRAGRKKRRAVQRHRLQE